MAMTVKLLAALTPAILGTALLLHVAAMAGL